MIVADDVWPVLVANADDTPAVLALAGTGATVLGLGANGHWARAGGRGPLLGDEGSAYAIAVAGLHAAARAVDGLTAASSLPNALVAETTVADFEALPAWCARSGKDAIAALATVVFGAAEAGDAAARDVVIGQAGALARHAGAVARRLGLPDSACVLLHGGLFEKSAYYGHFFTVALRELGITCPVRPVTYNGHAAVIRYASRAMSLPEETRAVCASAAA